MTLKLMVKIIGCANFLAASNLFAQNDTITYSKKMQVTAIAHFGNSIFKVRGLPGTPHYKTYEMHLGCDFTKPINEILKAGVGIHVGLKAKRKSYFYNSPVGLKSTEPWAILSLDEAASETIHLVTEFRSTIYFQPKVTRIGIKGGLAARFWGPNNDNVNALSSQNEFGAVTGAIYQITHSLGLGVEWYAGLKEIHGGSYSNPNGTFNFNVKNQYFMLTAEYRLK